jgi:hypothetical protein
VLQWLFTVCVRFFSLNPVSVSCVRVHSLPVLLLALIQCQDLAADEASPPLWSGPRQVTSDDGYVSLDWTVPKGRTAEFFKITENFNGQSKGHFAETSSLQARRLVPGNYEFTLQACEKGDSGLPQCGKPSDVLTLKVTNGVTTSLISDRPIEAIPGASFSNVDGGPDLLRPGDWYNPAKDGHGWSFFWANRLALAENDPLFGNSYDLVGVWYTLVHL